MLSSLGKFLNPALRIAAQGPILSIPRRTHLTYTTVRAFSDGGDRNWYRTDRRREGTENRKRSRHVSSSDDLQDFEDNRNWDEKIRRGNLKDSYWRERPSWRDTDNIGDDFDEIRPQRPPRRTLEDRELLSSGSSDEGSDVDLEEMEGTWNVVSLPQNSKKLSNMVMQANSKTNHKESQLVIVEGKHCISQLMALGFMPQTIFFSRFPNISSLQSKMPNIVLYKTPIKDFKFSTNFRYNQGLVAFFKISELTKRRPPMKGAMPVTVVCDHIKSNLSLANILKLSVAYGCKKLILTEGCTTPWNWKTLSVSDCAFAKVAIEVDVPWNRMEDLFSENIMVLVTESGDSVRSENEMASLRSIPTITLHSLDPWTSEKEVVLIIAERPSRTLPGMSFGAYNLILKCSGSRVLVPVLGNILLGGVNEMNVVMFELRKRWLAKHGDFEGNDDSEDFDDEVGSAI